MNNGVSHQSETRQQIETYLLEDLFQKKLEWTRATHQNRDATRQQFIDALNRFNRFVLDGKL